MGVSFPALAHSLLLRITGGAQMQQIMPAAVFSGGGSETDIGMESLKVKNVVLGLLCNIDLVKQGRKVDPVLLDALKYRYNVSSYDALWSDSASARSALTRIVLDDICIASQVRSLANTVASSTCVSCLLRPCPCCATSQIHAGLVRAAGWMPVCAASNLLRSLPISLFLTCWQSSALTPAF